MPFPTGGKARKLFVFRKARSGAVPEPTVKSGWEEVHLFLFSIHKETNLDSMWLEESERLVCPEFSWIGVFL